MWIFPAFISALVLLCSCIQTQAENGLEPSRNHGFEHRVFERIISMAEKYLGFLNVTRRQGTCCHGFSKYQQKCFKIFDYGMSWEEARKFCAALNTDLAITENAGELEFLQQQIKKGSFSQTIFWLGANDIQTEGKFVWTDRHGKTRPIGYAPWRKGQPNNTGNNEDCLDLHFSELEWNDYVCTTKIGFICQEKL